MVWYYGSMDWFCWENLNRKPRFLPSNWLGLNRLTFSHHPILWSTLIRGKNRGSTMNNVDFIGIYKKHPIIIIIINDDNNNMIGTFGRGTIIGGSYKFLGFHHATWRFDSGRSWGYHGRTASGIALSPGSQVMCPLSPSHWVHLLGQNWVPKSSNSVWAPKNLWSHMEVSWNGGSPKSSIYRWNFHYKQSVSG